MALIRITDPHEFRPVHIVMLVLCLLGLLGVCLLSSAEKAQSLPDGAIEWHPDSLLLAVVELLNLRNLQPTLQGVAVKNFVHGIVSGAGIFVAALGLVALVRGSSTPESETVIDLDEVAAGEEGGGKPAKRHIDATRTAQAILLVFLAWSAASALWSRSPEFSIRGTALLAMQAAWAFALGYGLHRRAAHWATHLLLAVLTLTAALAWAYHRERNPTLRASYPIGNPLLLAGVLIPALLLATTTAAGGVIAFGRRRVGRGLALVLGGLVAAGLCGYVVHLTGSRGPLLGLGAGVLALVFLAGKKPLKVAVLVLAVVGLVVVGLRLYGARYADSATGRSTSIRARLYAWDYALQLFAVQPVAGLGQGGYTLTADSLATGTDALADPAALEYRIGNAHSEYLEVATELGSIGIVLFIAALGLTWIGAARALPEITVPAQRRALLAVTAAHVGLCVAELFGVGLRLEGFPFVFYTVWGLVWALARPASAPQLGFLGRWKSLQLATVVGSLVLGLVVITAARMDYAAARAEYETELALARVDFDGAAAFAEQAYRDRLSPQRRAAAGRRLAETHLRIADALRVEYYDRLHLAQSQGTVDSVFANHLETSRNRLLLHLGAGLEVLAKLRIVEPSPYGVGLLAATMHALRADVAEVEGRAEVAAESRAAALEALHEQNLRQPFEPEVAARYVMASAGALPPLETLEIVARPLRLRRAPAIYLELLTAWGEADEFGQIILPVLDQLAAADPAVLATQAEQPFAAEKLRAGAIAAFVRGAYPRSILYTERAVALYARLTPSAPLAQASALAELADARFLDAPEHPQAALAAANDAVKQAPASERGRDLVNAVAQRLVIYHLAAGNEPAARNVIHRILPKASGPDLDLLVADRYVNLAYGVLNTMLSRAPDRLMTWAHRAVEIAPDSAPAWFLAADLAVQDGEMLDILRCVFQVIRCGTTAENLAALLDRALAKRPDDPTLLKLRAALNVAPAESDEPMEGSDALP